MRVCLPTRCRQIASSTGPRGEGELAGDPFPCDDLGHEDVRAGSEFDELFLTHLHSDHVCDLNEVRPPSGAHAVTARGGSGR